MTALETILIIAGILHFGLLITGSIASRLFTLRDFAPLILRVNLMHCVFVFWITMITAVVTMLLSACPLSASPFARLMCAMIAVAWLIRCLDGFTRFENVAYSTTTTVTSYLFVIIYFTAAFAPTGGAL
jgi:hypothetical protein